MLEIRLCFIISLPYCSIKAESGYPVCFFLVTFFTYPVSHSEYTKWDLPYRLGITELAYVKDTDYKQNNVKSLFYIVNNLTKTSKACKVEQQVSPLCSLGSREKARWKKRA